MFSSILAGNWVWRQGDKGWVQRHGREFKFDSGSLLRLPQSVLGGNLSFSLRWQIYVLLSKFLLSPSYFFFPPQIVTKSSPSSCRPLPDPQDLWEILEWYQIFTNNYPVLKLMIYNRCAVFNSLLILYKSVYAIHGTQKVFAKAWVQICSKQLIFCTD